MEVPRIWRLKAQRYRMVGSVCPTCGQLSFPPRPVCPRCAAQPVQAANSNPSEFSASIRVVEPVFSKG